MPTDLSAEIIAAGTHAPPECTPDREESSVPNLLDAARLPTEIVAKGAEWLAVWLDRAGQGGATPAARDRHDVR